MQVVPRRLGIVSAYASEGGLDGPFQPATVWSPMYALGHVLPPADADALWGHYSRLWEHVAQLGLDGVRLDVSWARLEPRPGQRDLVALTAYRDAIADAQSRGLWVSVCLVDLAWPSWLGIEAWLMPWVRGPLINYVKWATQGLGADGYYVMSDVEEMLSGYLTPATPPWRTNAADDYASARAHLTAWERECREELPGVVWVQRRSEQWVGRILEGRGPLSEVPALLDARRW